jgi:cytochrome c oxidase assembly protein subunit 15
VGEYLKGQGLGSEIEAWVKRAYWIMGLQLIAGFINVLLLAPVIMQAIHLFLADLFWVALIVVAANALTEGEKGTSN